MAERLSGYDVIGIVTNVLSLFMFIGTFVGRYRPTSQLLVLEDSWKRVEAALNSNTEETVVLNEELVRQIDRLRSRSVQLKQQVSSATTLPAVVIEVVKGLTCRILVVNSKVRRVAARITALQVQARYEPRQPVYFENPGMFQTLLQRSLAPPLAFTHVGPAYADVTMPPPAWLPATTHRHADSDLFRSQQGVHTQAFELEALPRPTPRQPARQSLLPLPVASER